MNKKSDIFKKILNSFVSLLLIFQSFTPSLLYAQEVTPTPSPTQEVSPTPSPTNQPTETPTPQPSEPTITPEPSPSATPTIEPTPTPSVEPSSSPEVSPTPSILPEASPEITPLASPSSESSPTDQVQSSSSPEPTVGQPNAPPSAEVEQPLQGHLSATILENTDAQSLQLDLTTQDISSASLITDKADYAPTDTAVITGSDFPKEAQLKLIITADNYRFEDKVTTNENGQFIYTYQLDGAYRPLYTVEAYDMSGALLATVTFTDTPVPSGGTKLEQWEIIPSGNWITGNLGASNSDYSESETVPFRLNMGTLSTGGNPYTFSICRDYQDGTSKGYLSLQPFNTSRSAAPGGTITSTNGPFSGINMSSISFTEVGGQGGCGSGERETQGSFNVTSSGSNTYLLWGGRLASPSDPGVGAGNGAASYSGSSLHMKLLSPNKDVGINPSAIIELAQITVTKVVDSGSANANQWCFNISPDLNGQSGAICGPSGIFTGLPTGSYTITESSVNGYSFASGTGTNCTFNGSTATASVTSATTATNATCNFHNAQQTGSVTLDKVTNPSQDPTSFPFTTTNLPVPTSPNLTDTATPVTWSSLSAGTYTITEVGVSGWTLSSKNCTGGTSSVVTPITNGVSISLAAGENVTCTFTNTRDTGTIELKKVWSGTGGQTTLNIGTSAGGTQVVSQQTGAAGTAPLTTGTKTVNTGTYYVSETGGLTDYSSLLACTDNGSPITPGTNNSMFVTTGHAVICTFTNTRNTGTLRVLKNVDLNGDGDYTDANETGATDWKWQANAGADYNTGDSAITVNTGNYALTETPKTDFHQIGLSCTGGTLTSNSVAVTSGASVVCTFTNTHDTGAIKVVKDVVPNDSGATGWDFAISGSTINNASDLQDGEESSIFTSITGSYTITESAHSGTNANNYNTTYSCADNTGVLVSGSGVITSSFNLSSNKNVVCTFTNIIKNGTIIIEKEMVGGTDSFSFTGNPAGAISTNDGQLSTSVLPGTYTAIESAKTGWDLTGLTCDDSNSITPSTVNLTTKTATFNVDPNETVKCTFTNTKRGHVIITKDAIPNNAQDFTFHNNFGNSNPDTFLLDDDSNGTLQDTRNFEVLPGGYSVSEDTTTGWKQSSATCDDGSPVNNISVSAGETVTCTFTNKKLGSIVLNKNTIGGNGTFDFVMTGQSLPGSVQLITASGSATQTFINIDPENTYTINETVPTGWDLSNVSCQNQTYDGSITPRNNTGFTITNGGTVTCTFTNTQRGTIIVEKQTDPDQASGSFTFTGDAAGNISDGGQITVNNLVPGTYASTEVVPVGWDLTNISCDDTNSTSNLSTQTATFNISAGEVVKCTFTNTKRGHLTVQKTTLPGGELDLFTVLASGSGTVTGQSSGFISDAQDSVFTMTPGTYSVSETVPTGWSKTDDTCQSVVVAAGQDETCNITNTKLGTIIVEKQTNPDGVSGNFTFSGAVSGTISDNGQITVDSLLPGIYTASEDDPTPGFDLTSVSCNDGQSLSISTGDVSSRSATFRLDPGETITCTFTNTKRGTILGTKQKVNSDSSLVGTLSGWVIRLFNGEAEVGQTSTDESGNFSFTNIVQGVYTLVEDLITTSWTQIFGPSQVNLNPGDSSTGNNFGNFQNGSIQGVKFNDINGDGQRCVFDEEEEEDICEPILSEWTITIIGPDEFSDQAITDENGYAFSNLGPGSYTVCEEEQPGWQRTKPAESNCETVEITSSGQEYTVDFGNQGRGTITVRKNVDTNGDGQVDENNVTNWIWDIGGDGFATGDQSQPVAAGLYTISEHHQDNYHVTAVECNNKEGYGLSESIRVSVGPGQDLACTFTNTRDTGSLHVNKVADTNGDGKYDTTNPENFRWGISAEITGYTMGSTQTLITGDYEVFENSVAGYSFTGWFPGDPVENQYSCNNLPEGDIYTKLPVAVTVSNEPKEITLCNQVKNPILTISKTNDTGGADRSPGASVLFTITVIATQSAVLNVQVTDLLPDGFKYQTGSWTATTTNLGRCPSGNLVACGITTEPTYASPGVWKLGDMIVDEKVILTYIANISGDQQPGLYKDLAWAKGESLTSTPVFANAEDPGFVDDNFVGTQVNIVKNPDGTAANIEKEQLMGEVLGASIVLPATGANALWIILAILLLAGGSGSIILGQTLRRKNV